MRNHIFTYNGKRDWCVEKNASINRENEVLMTKLIEISKGKWVGWILTLVFYKSSEAAYSRLSSSQFERSESETGEWADNELKSHLGQADLREAICH